MAKHGMCSANYGETQELLDMVDELASMLAEAHQEDVLDDHGGDQPGTCSYCKAIVRAENLLQQFGRRCDTDAET